MKGIEEINMILFLNIMSTDDYIYTFVQAIAFYNVVIDYVLW